MVISGSIGPADNCTSKTKVRCLKRSGVATHVLAPYFIFDGRDLRYNWPAFQQFDDPFQQSACSAAIEAAMIET